MICLNQFDQIMTVQRKIANVEGAIHLIRGQRAMLDSDLAAIYGVAIKRLNEQLRRNRSRFPSDFAFQLTAEEFTNLKSQIATSSFHGGRRYRPWVFTEPHEAPKRREIGFHVREEAARYRVRKAPRIKNRNSGIS
jgi:ORF6N domain-containing protein